MTTSPKAAGLDGFPAASARPPGDLGDRPRAARTASAESAVPAGDVAPAAPSSARSPPRASSSRVGARTVGLSSPAIRAAAAGGILGAGGGGLNAFGLGASYSGGLSLASHSCCQLCSSRRGAGGLGGGARWNAGPAYISLARRSSGSAGFPQHLHDIFERSSAASSAAHGARPAFRVRGATARRCHCVHFRRCREVPETANGQAKDSPVSELIDETAGAAPRWSTAARAMATTARRKKAEALLDAVGGDVSKAIRAGKSTELPLRGGARRAGHRRILLGGGGGGAVVNPPPSRPRPSVHPSFPSQSPTQISNPPTASIAQSTSSATTSRRSRPR